MNLEYHEEVNVEICLTSYPEVAKFDDRIISDSRICSGKPCVKGTRIPVHLVLDLLAAGESYEGVKKAYPNLNDNDIMACIQYAALLTDEEAGVLP